MSNATLREGAGKLTGAKVLMIAVGFYGVVFVVNAVMAYDAISTFRGEVNAQPYEVGLAYNSEIKAAKAQEARDWRVDVNFSADGRARTARIAFADSAGRPVEGLAVEARYAAPADVKRDQKFALKETTSGTYVGAAEPGAGAWDFEITASRDGKTLFQSKNRISVN